MGHPRREMSSEHGVEFGGVGGLKSSAVVASVGVVSASGRYLSDPSPPLISVRRSGGTWSNNPNPSLAARL